MASSLLWHAAAWGDEWVDYATAVTVTDGYVCAGELYGDGTGTDIKCDSSNPYIADDGNVGIGTASPGNSLTIVGDASVTTLNAVQLCDETGANCTDLSGGLSGVSSLASLTDVSVSTPSDNNLLRYNTSTSKWEAVGINDGLSTTTMVPSWPDAIQCEKGADVRLLYYAHSHTSGSITKYRNLNNTTGDYYVQYNTSDGTYSGSTSGMVAFDCVTNSWSIADLYANGRAFNFLGNNGTQISLTEIADVSASAPTDGQVLRWDDANSEWVPADASAGVSTLVSLTDVSSTAATEGQVLSYNDTTNSWEPSDTNVINALNDVGDVSASAIGDGQVLTYNTSSSKWEPQDAAPAEFSCPAGFTLIQNAGQTLGCMQTDDNSAATWPNAVDACYDNYGGRLPAAAEWYAAVANYSLSGETDDFEWLSDAVGISSGGSNDNHTVIGSGSITNLSFRVNTDTGTNYRCFIPASGQISMTTVAALSDVSAVAPQDGDTLTWNSSTERWEAGSSSGGGTPSGAVMAFNLASCPSGWSEYTLARGRFIRGIDSTGTNDPDGVRALGSTQTDDFKSHSHSYSAPPLNNYKAQAGGFTNNVTAGSAGSNSGNSGGDETRPINVALLYCEKD